MAISPDNVGHEPICDYIKVERWEKNLDEWFKGQTQKYEHYVYSSYESLGQLEIEELKNRYLKAGWGDVKISVGGQRDPAITITFFREKRCLPRQEF